jgi:Ca-activated chloride channel family protein
MGIAMNAKHILFNSLFLVSSVVNIAWLDPYRDAVTNGNDEYSRRKYSSAKQHYQKAAEYAPGENDRKNISFNEGDADYMLENYEGAVSYYQSAIQSDDRDVQKKAFFNIGNAYLKQGNYQEAIGAYMNALKIDPQYDRAKKNIEYILKQINDRKSGKDKNQNKNDKGNQASQNKQEKEQKSSRNRERQSAEKKNKATQMNKEQIENILKSMQQNPVQRRKGDTNERKKLEKFW